MLKKDLELLNARLEKELAEVRAELLEVQESHRNLMSHLKTATVVAKASKADVHALASTLYFKCADERAVLVWLKSVDYVVNNVKYFGIDVVKLLNRWYSERIPATT